MKPVRYALLATLAAFSTGCIVRETVTEHGEVVSDKLKVEEPFQKKEVPTL